MNGPQDSAKSAKVKYHDILLLFVILLIRAHLERAAPEYFQHKHRYILCTSNVKLIDKILIIQFNVNSA